MSGCRKRLAYHLGPIFREFMCKHDYVGLNKKMHKLCNNLNLALTILFASEHSHGWLASTIRTPPIHLSDHHSETKEW